MSKMMGCEKHVLLRCEWRGLEQKQSMMTEL